MKTLSCLLSGKKLVSHSNPIMLTTLNHPMCRLTCAQRRGQWSESKILYLV